LYKALPVPPEDVALADILGFRDRRRAELLAFRNAMDDLYPTLTAARYTTKVTRDRIRTYEVLAERTCM
jgi:Family of unknown function (DUF6236)